MGREVVLVLVACVAALGAAGCACGEDPSSLAVDVKTDLVPGVEFTAVRVVLETADPRPETVEHAARRSDATVFRTGERVAELSRLREGSHRIRVALLGPSRAVVLERAVAVAVRGNVLVTVVLTRDCRGVVCPEDADASSATECLGGRCVDPRCADGTDAEVCVGGECSGAAECTPVVACATGVCDGASCLFFEEAGTCAADEYCDPDRGCTELAPETDAGADPDAGGEDGGAPCDPSACDDGIGCTTDGCDAAGCTHTADDGLCTDRPGGSCDPATGCHYPCASRADCTGGDTCHEGACVAATAFRITRLVLRDPQLDAYVGMAPFCSCADATPTLNDAIQRDVDGRSVPVYVFLPLDRDLPRNDFEAHAVARCPDTASCGPGADAPERTEATHTATGDTPCYVPDASTLGPYPRPSRPLPPCFRADQPAVDLDVAGTTIALTDVHTAATFGGSGLVSGILAGFLTEGAARAATVPSEVPLCGGRTAYDMLRGGGSCRSGDDRDGSGWWVYFDFEAVEVDWTG